jgi:hypothetical protein
MCVARKSGPGREYSVAVDWRDCAWSPRIVVQFPAVQLEGVLPKSFWRRRSAAVSAAARSINQKPVEFRALIRQSGLLRVGHPRSVPFGQHARGIHPSPAGDKTITRRNRIIF